MPLTLRSFVPLTDGDQRSFRPRASDMNTATHWLQLTICACYLWVWSRIVPCEVNSSIPSMHGIPTVNCLQNACTSAWHSTKTGHHSTVRTTSWSVVRCTRNSQWDRCLLEVSVPRLGLWIDTAGGVMLLLAIIPTEAIASGLMGLRTVRNKQQLTIKILFGVTHVPRSLPIRPGSTMRAGIRVLYKAVTNSFREHVKDLHIILNTSTTYKGIKLKVGTLIGKKTYTTQESTIYLLLYYY